MKMGWYVLISSSWCLGSREIVCDIGHHKDVVVIITVIIIVTINIIIIITVIIIVTINIIIIIIPIIMQLRFNNQEQSIIMCRTAHVFSCIHVYPVVPLESNR